MISEEPDAHNNPASDTQAGRIDMPGGKGVQVGDHNTQTNNFSLLRADQIAQVNLFFPQPDSASPAGDHTAAVAATVTRHRRRNRMTRPSIMAAHPSVSLLVHRLRSPEGRGVVVVHGRAGSGKSTVVTDAVQQLLECGWAAAVVRMDAVDDVCRTANALGRASELTSSPTTVLEAAAEGGAAVLVVDQLDAVSIYSGRMSDSYEAVAELIEQAHQYEAMKVVLVVRTADLSADPRMSSLLIDEERVETFEVGYLDAEAVRAALADGGVEVGALSSVTLDLLRVPLHLAVFSGLPAESRSLPYRTLPDLYQEFTQQVLRTVEESLGASGWHGVIAPLVAYMSDHEVLQAPAGLLDRLPVRARQALISAGLLVADGANLEFFHETYFDFLFARAFVAQGSDLHDFLERSGQQLFRRAQTRQVLEHLIGVDRRRFRRDVVRLLGSKVIRAHLLDIVIGVLSSLPASAEDWSAIEPLAFGDSRRRARLVGLLSSPNWFDAADWAGRWEPLLTQPVTATTSADVLIMAARERAERVTQLVQPFAGTSEQWTQRLRAMVQWSLSPELVDLTVDLLQRGLLDGARGPISVNSDFWSIVYGLKDDDPAGAARIVGAYLDRARVRARADGVQDPFPNHVDQSRGSGGESTITDIATAAPEQFLGSVLPFVLAVLADTAVECAGEFKSGLPWRYRDLDSHEIHGAVLDGVDIALRATAPQLWASDSHVIDDLASSDWETARFLACRAYTVIADQAPNEAVDWLLSDDRNLRLGWRESGSWASRQLVEAASSHCQDDRFTALCVKLLDYYPAWELTASARQARGYGQYELLSAVPAHRLSSTARRRLGELERKFPDDAIRPPKVTEAHFVGPPVPEAAGKHMTDLDWRRAITKYSAPMSAGRPDYRVGGSRQLAGLLGRRAGLEPQRFVKLALTFDEHTPAAHIIEVINAVAGKISSTLLTQVCQHAHRIADAAVGRTICTAVANTAEDATEPLIDLLEHYAQAEDPERERTELSANQRHDKRDLSTEGLNSTRGMAAEAISHVVFAQQHYASRLLPTIRQLAKDPILSVRAQATRPVLALFDTNLEHALDIADELFNTTPIDILYSDAAGELLHHAVHRDPDRFAPHLNRALEASDPIAVRAGYIWANALLNELLPTTCPSTPDVLPVAARRGSATVIASAPNLAIDTLIDIFGDEDQGVREAASAVIRKLHEVDTAVAERILAAFTISPAFPEHFEDLFGSLKRSLRLLPSTTIAACERAVENSGADLGDLRTARAAISRDIVTVVLRLYRQGDAAMRTRCLDVVDKLSDVGAYGLPEALQHER